MLRLGSCPTVNAWTQVYSCQTFGLITNMHESQNLHCTIRCTAQALDAMTYCIGNLQAYVVRGIAVYTRKGAKSCLPYIVSVKTASRCFIAAL